MPEMSDTYVKSVSDRYIEVMSASLAERSFLRIRATSVSVIQRALVAISPERRPSAAEVPVQQAFYLSDVLQRRTPAIRFWSPYRGKRVRPWFNRPERRNAVRRSSDVIEEDLPAAAPGSRL